ncbi:hypothetical protein LTR02_002786 [Friedmanniomyces endolithicus]|nr:hypothetical protein LTR02_002786 [Friedmanniomyces endolithicus]
MKFSQVLPLAALSSAFVLPAEEVLAGIAIEDNHRQTGWSESVAEAKNDAVAGFKKHFEEVTDMTKHAWGTVVKTSKNTLDEAFELASSTADTAEDSFHDAASGIASWLRTEGDDFYDSFDGPPDGPPDHDPDHGHRPHHPPHHGPHGPHGPPNQTVYQLISGSKYTTKLAKLINKYDDLVEILNSTSANYTVFAPTDKAFEKIPEHHPEPSKEVLKAILSYHVVNGSYPAGRVLVTHTAPTLLEGKHLSSSPRPQRVAFNITLRGLTVNFYSRIIAVNIFATNGVIHGVDSLIIPPPNVIKIVDLLPTEFSTLELALGKTGLLETLNTTDHAGGTLLAPSNFAFKKLGPKINAFLFSQFGLKYLKALLEYHVIPDNTLYSDAFYQADSSDDEQKTADYRIPKGIYHVDLPTMLKDRSVAVDIARYGGLIEMKINAFARVAVQDGIAEDGVIQVVGDVVVPPKKIGGPGKESVEFWQGEEMSVGELKERLEPLLLDEVIEVVYV